MTPRKKLKNNQGFTLVEVLMYVALMTMSIGSFVGFGVHMSDLRAKASVIEEVENNARIVMNDIVKYAKSAEGIIAPVASMNSSTTLELDMLESDADQSYELLDGVFYATEGVANPVQLTSDSVEIKNLIFENTSKTGQKGSIKLSFDMRYRYDSSVAYQYSKSYQSVISLR